ncbi:MAG: hypothetical protein DSZ30_03710 [Aquificaceae bacterium]|nr:MAG: hypothetical protein DSZ30_03710 [Aquificaceae bacterium]
MENPLFLTQTHLSRVALWLTLFGYPTKVVTKLTKKEISLCTGGRCKVLTTSRRLEKTLKNLKVEYLILPNWEDWKTQLCMVLKHFNLKPNLSLNYCPLCLGKLKPVTPEEVKGKISEGALRCGKNFTICPSCGKVYWEGGHKRLMEKTLKQLKLRCGDLFNSL